MVAGYLLAVLLGAICGVPVNLLADRLPGSASDTPEEVILQQTKPGRQRLAWLRYAVVEAVLVAASIYLWWRYSPSLLYAVHLLYLAIFTLIAVVDIEHRLVLRSIMLPAFAFALAEVLLSGRIEPLNGLAGFAIGQIALMAFYLLGEGYLRLVNARRAQPVEEVAFGSGDVTLGTFCGLLLGYPLIVPMLVLMVLIGGALAAAFVLVRLAVARRYQAHMPLPYGPAILLATTLLLLWGPAIARWFGAQ
jgi:leader peptidase (prepilin peptidase)/N-methyltransferase